MSGEGLAPGRARNCGCRIIRGGHRIIDGIWGRGVTVNPDPDRVDFCEQHAHLAETVELVLRLLGSRR